MLGKFLVSAAVSVAMALVVRLVRRGTLEVGVDSRDSLRGAVIEVARDAAIGAICGGVGGVVVGAVVGSSLGLGLMIVEGATQGAAIVAVGAAASEELSASIGDAYVAINKKPVQPLSVSPAAV